MYMPRSEQKFLQRKERKQRNERNVQYKQFALSSERKRSENVAIKIAVRVAVGQEAMK